MYCTFFVYLLVCQKWVQYYKNVDYKWHDRVTTYTFTTNIVCNCVSIEIHPTADEAIRTGCIQSLLLRTSDLYIIISLKFAHIIIHIPYTCHLRTILYNVSLISQVFLSDRIQCILQDCLSPSVSCNLSWYFYDLQKPELPRLFQSVGLQTVIIVVRET